MPVPLKDEMFIRLTTFRKSGEPVGTPVCFAQNGDRLYVVTNSATGKVRRLRSTPRVEIEACDQVGRPHGEKLTGRARVLAEVQAAAADELLGRKYRMQKQMIDYLVRSSGNPSVFVEITLDQPKARSLAGSGHD